jgi:PQQ-dependent catabolism-associated CXXCW motif protein
MISVSWRRSAIAGYRELLLILVALGSVAPTASVEAGGDEAGEAAAQTPVTEPDGYRLDNYRAATPATLRGGTVLKTAALQALWHGDGVILVDVLPQQKRPDNLPATTLWIAKPRYDIPGSVWLPDVGRGALSPAVEAYFKENLARLTAGDRDRGLIFYCLRDCWMSWNAAKRAISYGYRRVYWYPDGTDGWSAAALPTAEVTPVPMRDGQ